MNTIFFSWQSDLPNSYNRNLIENVIKSTLKKINRENNLSLVLDIDRNTDGLLGSPDIADSILKKIDKCDIFIADISIINKSSTFRKTPNPNVLFELGYAVSRIGWDRVICVFNSDYGDLKDIPFDLRNRRIIQYNSKDITRTKQSLINLFEEIINDNTESLITSREITDYYSVNIYSSFLNIISRISGMIYGNEVKTTPKLINEILSLSHSEISNKIDNQQIGFNLFSSYSETIKRLEMELDRITQIYEFDKRLYVPIIQLIRELKFQKLWINRETCFSSLLTNHKAENYTIVTNTSNSNLEHRYVLGKKLPENKIIILEHNDIQRKDHVSNLLSYYLLDDKIKMVYLNHISVCLKLINDFIKYNDGTFLIDNTEILINGTEINT